MSFARQIDEQRYRETTERQASMPGVMSPTFRCVACKRRSVTKGCKKISVGRICAECHQARKARRAFKNNPQAAIAPREVREQHRSATEASEADSGDQADLLEGAK